MRFVLLGRTEKKMRLAKCGTFKSYREAVVEGQRQFGHGNFMVESIGKVGEGYVPTREEQLLQDDEKTQQH